jgi:dolichol kinase
MCLQSLEVFFVLARDDMKIATKLAVRLFPGLVTTLLLFIVLHQEVVFSCITGLFIQIIYRFTFIAVMKSLPFSFTLGEASIVTQALVIFLYNCYLKLPFIETAKTLNDDLNLLLQIGLLGVISIALVAFIVPIFRRWFLFYALFFTVVFIVCLVPIRDKLAIAILIDFIFSDLERIGIVGVYIALLALAGFAVSWQIKKSTSVTTSVRKIFHVLIVMVFVPGLIFQCQFLYVASTVILAVFIVLETARVIQLYPVSEVLETSVKAFIDEKDAGKIALTPIYLLVGCAAPLWIHNSPCDLTGSSAFELLPLLSGVLSIGIGDTFASIVGSTIGRHKWGNTSKSVEGTLASIAAQAAFIYSLNFLGFIPLSLKLSAVCGIAVISNSLIEALTDQVDNLVLPLVTYIVLAYK